MMFKKGTLAILLFYIAYGSCNSADIKLTKMFTQSINPFGNKRSDSEVIKTLSHLLKTRQADDDPNFNRCFVEALPLLCEEGGHFQQLVDIGLDCGFSTESARDTAILCSVDSDGKLCGTITSGVEFLENALTQCLTGSNACPSGCANALRALRENFGCCISGFNNSESSNPIFANSLWSGCGVQTVSLCESTVNIGPGGGQGGTQCSDEEYDERVINAMCPDTLNRVVKRLRNVQGCSQLVDFYSEPCTVNSQGEFCSLVRASNDLFNPILNNCTMDQPSCPDGCVQSLEALRNDLGCCINSRFNGTTGTTQVTAFVTDYTLWKQCNVETPPLSCQNLLSGGRCTTTISAILIAVSTFLVAMWNI